MNKILISIFLTIIFLLIYFLQINFFNWFTIAGVSPNLFIILIIIIGLFGGDKTGLIFGVIFGFILDIYIGNVIGINAIFLGLIGYFVKYLDKSFSKESRITLILIVAVATVICEVGKYIIQIIIERGNFNIIGPLKVLSIEVLYNSILTIILYSIILKLGYLIEKCFKQSKIMHRYFEK